MSNDKNPGNFIVTEDYGVVNFSNYNMGLDENKKALKYLGISYTEKEKEGVLVKEYKASSKVGVVGVVNNNNERIPLIIRCRFSELKPLKMLSKVAESEKFLEYETIAKGDKKPFYEFDYKKKIIESPDSDDGEALTAFSYVMLLYDLCKRQLKPQMSQIDENLNGRVKGRILFKQHLRHNVMKGQEQRVFCRYQINTVDNIENRILKAALHQSKRILQGFNKNQGSKNNGWMTYVAFCEHVLRDVREVPVSRRDLSLVRTTGYYAYYKPSLAMARQIILKSYVSLPKDNEVKLSSKTLPYFIDMQRLFEVYIYSKLDDLQRNPSNETIKSELYQYEFKLDNDFKQKYDTLTGGKVDKSAKDEELYEHGNKKVKLHIQKLVEPDYYLTIKQFNNEHTLLSTKTVILDAKYKHSDHFNVGTRSDTLQIFAYGNIFQADGMGFVFPLEDNKENYGILINQKEDKNNQRFYFETFVSLKGKEDQSESNSIESIINFIIEKLFNDTISTSEK